MKPASYFSWPRIGLIVIAMSLLSGAAQAEFVYRLTVIESPANPGYHLGVHSLNNKGEVVGVLESDGIRAFHWKDGVYTDLSDALGLNSRELEAVAINDRSLIIGNRGDGPPRNFRLHNNQLRAINVSPGGDSANVSRLNNRNQVVGRSEGRPFIWFRGVTTYLPGLPGSDEFSNRANAINDAGVATGLSGTLDGQSAVVWKNGEIIVLDPRQVRSTAPVRISTITSRSLAPASTRREPLAPTCGMTEFAPSFPQRQLAQPAPASMI